MKIPFRSALVARLDEIPQTATIPGFFSCPCIIFRNVTNCGFSLTCVNVAVSNEQAPGGWMHAEAQEAARLQMQQQVQQQQQQQQQQQRIQPVLAQGELAEMAESMRRADAGELSDEVRRHVPADRQQALPHLSYSGLDIRMG